MDITEELTQIRIELDRLCLLRRNTDLTAEETNRYEALADYERQLLEARQVVE